MYKYYMSKRKTTVEFIQEANIIYDSIYDYSRVNYINSITKVEIICKEHGSFWQTPGAHLTNRSCPKCSLRRRSQSLTNTTSNFIKKSIEKHNLRYLYNKVNYIQSKKKVEIICKEHGSFWQTPSSHLMGRGCPNCKIKFHNKNFYKDKPTILYYIKVENLYKIGVTTRSVKERFRKDKKNIQLEVINEWNFDNGLMAFNIEQNILKTYKLYKYNGENILEKGNSELFTTDILNLNKKEKNGI